VKLKVTVVLNPPPVRLTVFIRVDGTTEYVTPPMLFNSTNWTVAVALSGTAAPVTTDTERVDDEF
jgi:hypothetical protein